MERGIAARKGWLWGILSLVLCFALVSSAVAPALADDAEGGCDDCPSYSIMRPDRETLERWIEAYNNAPRAYIEMEGFQVPSPRGSLSLLDHLEYTPAERNQGNCGNCWAWAGTGCLGIALHVQEGIKDRLSVQYINSCQSGDYACCGGWLSDLANFYDPTGGTGMCIPWSNTNASWQDISKLCADGSSDVNCGSISTAPNYPITAIQEQVVPTLPLDGVTDQATAIANIKNVLGQNKAVWFAFYLPNSAAWTGPNGFITFWNNNAESDVYDMDQFCSIPYNDSPGEGGGHAVLCVGYNDDSENSYWVMLNSWGTTAGRPNGLFRIDMDMNYQCVNDPYYSFYWQTLDVTFDIAGQPDITVSPTSFEVTLPPDVTHDCTLTISNDGDADLTYTITDRTTGGDGNSTAGTPPPPQSGPDKINANELPLFEGLSPPPSPDEEYVPDQLIVKFKDRVLSAEVEQLNQSLGTEVIYTSPFAGFKVLQVPEGKTVPEMVELYSKQSIVEYAEPNYIDHAMWSPNDSFYSYQWHFDQINMEAAWDLDTTPPIYGGDPSIVVAVIDSGVAYETYGGYMQAPDLASTTFTSGYDFVNGDAHPNDDNSHGTHVCGTIAQSTNNGLGVAGIAFNTAIMPVKVWDSTGSGTHAQMADGFHYAADNGAHIINYSGGGPHSTTKENAVAYAHSQGVIIVAAAGNDYETGNDPEYPAAYDDYCIAVGATRYDQAHAYYSNTGSYLDIAAPGGDTNVDQNGDGYVDGVLQQTFNIYTQNTTDFAYWFLQGTSMACPHVAGVAALILAKNPDFTPDQVRQCLESTATDLGSPGRDDMYGWGLLNAPAAVAAAADCPWLSENPTSGSVGPAGSHNITVSINTTGLGSNYTAEIVIASNDPDEDPTVVPVTLHVHAGQPDLVVSKSIEFSGDNFTVSYNVTNIGNVTANASTTCKSVNGTLEESQPCPALNPGESYNGTFDPEPCPCGESLNVTVCADNDDVVAESNETNNCEINIVNCPAMPDLVITEKSEEWVDFEAKTYNITYTVTNQGCSAAGASNTTITINGTDVLEDPVPALVAGANHSNTVGPFTMSGNSANITVCADNGDVVDESDEDNNCQRNAIGLMEGDANLNGCVSIVDALLIAQYLAGIRTISPDQLQCADTTDEGSVSIVDALHIAQWLVDPDGSLGVLAKPLWESPADDDMLPPQP